MATRPGVTTSRLEAVESRSEATVTRREAGTSRPEDTAISVADIVTYPEDAAISAGIDGTSMCEPSSKPGCGTRVRVNRA